MLKSNIKATSEEYLRGEKKMYIKADEKCAVERLSNNIRKLINDSPKSGKEIVILCIGTDRSTGDSLGPLTGTFLKNTDLQPKIIGSLSEPLHAQNLEETLAKVDKENSLIIAVDACLGKMDHVGMITVHQGSIKPGSGVGKENLSSVGDISITSIVNYGGFMDFLVLQNTRLNVVYKSAKIISQAIYDAMVDVGVESFKDICCESVRT